MVQCTCYADNRRILLLPTPKCCLGTLPSSSSSSVWLPWTCIFGSTQRWKVSLLGLQARFFLGKRGHVEGKGKLSLRENYSSRAPMSRQTTGSPGQRAMASQKEVGDCVLESLDPYMATKIRARQRSGEGVVRRSGCPKVCGTRRRPDYSSNLCPPKIWSIWPFLGGILGLLPVLFL